MGFFYIFSLLLAVMFIRTVSFGVWNIKNRNRQAGVALFVLALLTAAGGILYLLT